MTPRRGRDHALLVVADLWIRVEIARPLGQTNNDLIASKRTKLLLIEQQYSKALEILKGEKKILEKDSTILLKDEKIEVDRIGK